MSVVNENCLVKIDQNDLKAIYAPLGCGFQTGAGTILNVLKSKSSETVAVFGLGSVGLTALMAAVLRRIQDHWCRHPGPETEVGSGAWRYSYTQFPGLRKYS